jgi:hypothetical protein
MLSKFNFIVIGKRGRSWAELLNHFLVFLLEKRFFYLPLRIEATSHLQNLEVY